MALSSNYYALLGVDEHASSEAIHKAFKGLALQYHPDIYKGPDAEEKMRALLLAYQTLRDPERRRIYDRDHTRKGGYAASAATAGNVEDEQSAAKMAFVFPPLADDLPAQIDVGEITYLLSASEVRRLKELGMLRGNMVPTRTNAYYCHRCRYDWHASSVPKICPNCQAKDWREYLLLRCQYCHAVFESEQIRDEIGGLRYGDNALCHPYELFPLCPSCGKAKWCPAEEERLWNVRDRAARKQKWRKRFGLE
jgi:curved DNA-binding protein CbpA